MHNKAEPNSRKSTIALKDLYRESVGDSERDVSQFINNQLREEKTYGYVKPYIPVIQDPVVRKVWVPDHKSNENADLLVGGHWVYLMIQGPRWFIEGESTQMSVPVIVPQKRVDGDKK